MRARTVPRKKSLREIDRTNLRPLPMSEEDWKDFAHGVRLFNARKFWHAHEAWEEVWKRRPEESRVFLQGLILTAAAYHSLLVKRTTTGALNNFAKALARLELFEPQFMGVRVTPLVRAIMNWRDRLSAKEAEVLESPNLNELPTVEWKRAKLTF